MAEAKHTPAPWVAEGRGTNLTVVFKGEPRAECSRPGLCVLMDGNESERQANAALMAAAPDMLDALITAREFISTDRNSLADASTDPDGNMEADDAAALADYDGALVQIDAAIAKAGSPT